MIQEMTYILGSRCSDGVVLVADRKVTLGGGATHAYEDKLFSDIFWMVVGSSGVSGLFEKFREKLQTTITDPKWDKTVPAFTTQIELITRELNAQYREVLGGQVFDVLLGVKTTAEAVLKYIYPIGFAESVRKYKVIGHGEPYGSFFLKQWWRPEMTMLEVAELGFFIIKFIQECELDNTVGIGEGYPQVWLIPSGAIKANATPDELRLLNPQPMSQDDLKAIETRILRRLAQVQKIPWTRPHPS